MRLLKQSTAANIMVFMAQSSDHVTGATGLTLTITASKDGAAFASITPTVTERGTGWYNLALTTAHTDTLGDLALHVTATGADPSDLICRVTDYTGEADAVLDRNMGTGTDSGGRTVRNALRFLRNKWSVAAGTLTVTKEDDTTTAWTGAVTGSAGSDPITTVDPA